MIIVADPTVAVSNSTISATATSSVHPSTAPLPGGAPPVAHPLYVNGCKRLPLVIVWQQHIIGKLAEALWAWACAMSRGLPLLLRSVEHGTVLTHPNSRPSPPLTRATPSACCQLKSREKPHWTARDLHVHGSHGSTAADAMVTPVLVVWCWPSLDQQILIPDESSDRGLGRHASTLLHVHSMFCSIKELLSLLAREEGWLNAVKITRLLLQC